MKSVNEVVEKLTFLQNVASEHMPYSFVIKIKTIRTKNVFEENVICLIPPKLWHKGKYVKIMLRSIR